ncbi:MAG TPA: hypothetical protein PLQ36_01945 [Candidatus Gracilibacteria bacterium]|nr:hypothetical protein [Candidatus Gracilibacteria bacterium]
MNKNRLFTIGTLALLLTTVSVSAAAANNVKKVNRPDAETRTKLEEAMKTGDYATWSSLNAKMHTISEEEFKTMTAERQEREAEKAKIEAALTSGDYATWAKYHEGQPILEKVTAANFAKFAEAHKLIKSGQAILAELGIEKGPMGEGKMPMMRGQGMKMEKGNFGLSSNKLQNKVKTNLNGSLRRPANLPDLNQDAE